MRIVVTGAGGFVGQALVTRLLADGDTEIISVTRKPTPKADRITSMSADLMQTGWTKDLPKSADVVIALAQSRRYSEFPEGAIDMAGVNIAANAELLDWASQANVKRFVFASTGNVYKQSNRPLTEQDVCDPAGFYASTKLAGEYLARSYESVFQVVIARLFGVYGPNQQSGLFKSLLNSVAQGRPITLAGGEGLRLTPIFIDDCADALARLSMHPLANGCTTVNVGGDEDTDIRKITSVMGELLRKPVVTGEASGQPASLMADSNLLYELIGWKPKTPLRDGIAQMVQALR